MKIYVGNMSFDTSEDTVNGKDLDGRTLNVSESRPKAQGGGGGGRGGGGGQRRGGW
jgi:hypothetical protein